MFQFRKVQLIPSLLLPPTKAEAVSIPQGPINTPKSDKTSHRFRVSIPQGPINTIPSRPGIHQWSPFQFRKVQLIPENAWLQNGAKKPFQFRKVQLIHLISLIDGFSSWFQFRKVQLIRLHRCKGMNFASSFQFRKVQLIPFFTLNISSYPLFQFRKVQLIHQTDGRDIWSDPCFNSARSN